MRLRAALAAVLGAAMLALAAIGAGAATTPDYSKMIVVSGKKSAQATLGTRCHPNPDGGESKCIETTYPLKTTSKVTLRAGERVTLLLGAPATDVRWRGARIDGTGKEQLVTVGAATPITKTQKRWRIQLPMRMSARTKLLGFDVIYKNAYSSFEVGARVARTRSR
jgi:hypothetical protein